MAVRRREEEWMQVPCGAHSVSRGVCGVFIVVGE